MHVLLEFFIVSIQLLWFILIKHLSDFERAHVVINISVELTRLELNFYNISALAGAVQLNKSF